MTRPLFHDLRVRNASQQYSDTTPQKAFDAKLAFAAVNRLRPHIITFTEVGKGQNAAGQRLIRTQAERLGYETHFDGYEGGIATRFGAVLDHGYEGPIIPGKAGDHPHIGLSWVLLRHSLYPDIAVGVTHWLNRDYETQRARLNDAMSREITRFLDAKAGPNGVGLLAGDTNRDDQQYDVLPGTGWTTAWDKLGVWPTTHGKNRTIDIWAHNDADANVRVKSGRALPRGYSDHNRIDVTYSINKKRTR